VRVKLSGEGLAKYYAFEKERVMMLEDENEISAVNAAALAGKLLQYANGAVYDADKAVHEVHQDKIEALEEILEAANGKPVLVFYSYRHDVDRIKKALKKYHPEELQGSAHIKLWNDGKVPFLLCHPASAGHGLNMQAGGNIIVWFGLPWSLELYMQANARLDRQGQTQSVIIHHLITTGTIDEDVVQALTNKAVGQEALMTAVKARVLKYLKTTVN
jgi:SNF2 family DNA or RNA helicase